MNNSNKIIVILGQTSTGKSDFAVEIAKKLKKNGTNSEIISADSRQVYRGMDLGTGKITKKEMGAIPHHLLDVISPKKVFSVDSYQKLANKKIEEIFERGNIPIICGGTGFYIDTLINKTFLPKVPPNKKLRKELDKLDTETLYKKLEKLDKDRAENIDKKNKVRLIRAIEIAETLRKKQSDTNSAGAEFVSLCNFKILKIGLTLPPEILKERIYSRLISRIKEGMIEEIQELHNKGISWRRMYDLGLEQRHVSMFLQNKIDKKEMIKQLNTKIWRYAKRQKTWFKRDKKIIWINPLKKESKDKVIKIIEKFLK